MSNTHAIPNRPARLATVAALIVLWVSAPAVARAGGIPPFTADEQQAWCEVVAAAHVEPESADEPAGVYAEADALLADVETHLCMARFEVALEHIRHDRSRMSALPDAWQSERRRARLEILAATAKIALGDTESAALNFRWALEIDPYLDLDPAETSPKVLEQFRRSRDGFLASR